MSTHGRVYDLVQCTKKAVFESTLTTLTNVKILVTSVLSNFISKACSGDDLTAAANREITAHVEALHQYSLTSPTTCIAVAPPLPRSVPDWFLAYLPGFCSFLYHEVSRMCNPKIKFMAPFVAPPSYFESDGIHLNRDAGLSFIFYLVSSSDQLYPPEAEEAGGVPESGPSSSMVSSSLASLSKSVNELRSDVNRRCLQDNLIFARIKEDRDHDLNRSKEDRCTLSGFSVTSPPPIDAKERKEFFKNLVSKLVEEACPELESRPQVLDVLVNMRFGRGPPYFEVKFDSVASSLKFRLSASKLAKDGIGSFQGVFVSNTVNMSTRIRIDILKVIAKRLTTPTEVCYVQGFSSRPTLHYRMKDVPSESNVVPVATPGTGRSYNFTESIERWGNLLHSQALEPIRRKACQAFRGCLEQYFVVLSDRETPSSEDSMFSRLTRPSSGSARHQARGGHRGTRGPQGSGARGRVSGANSWAQYDRDPANRSSVSAPQSLRGTAPSSSGIKRGLTPDAESHETPTKKRAEDE